MAEGSRGRYSPQLSQSGLPVHVFQSTYVGRHDFPKSLPDFLLQRWFTLNDRDRRAIRKAFRSRHWIGAALQLGFIGMTGTTLRSLEYVPAAVLRHLGRQFRQPVPDIATLRTLYRRRPTRFAHQRWAIKRKRVGMAPCRARIFT